MHKLGFLALAFTLLAGPAGAASASYTGGPGPFQVGTLEQTWHDARRDRDVPVKIYYPVVTAENERQSFPVIIFSHGLGGSREGYGYLGQYWAACGYISVHVQHAGSDGDALRGARPLENFKKIASDPAAAINRPLDISFAIDRLTALNADASFILHGRLDLDRLGVAGHSFGAFTTMAIAGARIPVLGTAPRFLDPRVKAAIAMSTPANRQSETDAAFDAVKIPVFHMTGTKDGSMREALGSEAAIVGDTKAPQRLLPYQHTRHAPAYLLVFNGGDHMVFSGRLTSSRPTDKGFQALVCSGSGAFWDAWLKGDPAAKKWLEDGGFAGAVAQSGTFAHKQ
jgi:predicted dienelactone hydrolase